MPEELTTTKDDETVARSSALNLGAAKSPSVMSPTSIHRLTKLFGNLGHKTKSATIATSATNPLMEDLDHVVASSATTAEEARDIFRTMVSDLLKENEILTGKLHGREQKILEIQTQHDKIVDEYIIQLKHLQESLTRVLGNDKNEPLTKAIEQFSTKVGETSFVVTPQQATEMIIQSLSRKIEQINAENTVLKHDLMLTRERMEDLESLNEARLHTIEALEAQFHTINHKNRTQRSVTSSGRRGVGPHTGQENRPMKHSTKLNTSNSLQTSPNQTFFSITSPDVWNTTFLEDDDWNDGIYSRSMWNQRFPSPSKRESWANPVHIIEMDQEIAEI